MRSKLVGFVQDVSGQGDDEKLRSTVMTTSILDLIWQASNEVNDLASESNGIHFQVNDVDDESKTRARCQIHSYSLLLNHTYTDSARLSTNTNSHPKTQLPARRPSSDPILRLMKHRDRRHRRNALSTKLRQLLPLTRVNINESIHITHRKPLNPVSRALTPLRAQNGDPSTGLVIVWNHRLWLHLGF